MGIKQVDKTGHIGGLGHAGKNVDTKKDMAELTPRKTSKNNGPKQSVPYQTNGCK